MEVNEQITKETTPPRGLSATIYCDGSCPENPGVMGIGYSISIHPQPPEGTGYQLDYGYRLEKGTNNQAEYLALVSSLRDALRQGVTHVEVFSDSMLMVQQVNGKWKVKETSLKNLAEEAIGLSKLFTRFKLAHVNRDYNAHADYLSKHPTEPSLPPRTIEIDTRSLRIRRRQLTRWQAALIRYWWVKDICRNEYRLERLFGGTASNHGKLGNGLTYRDITQYDLPGHRRYWIGVKTREDEAAEEVYWEDRWKEDPDVRQLQSA